ncbi:MAG: N-6 DNA methylase [Thermoguttaceae bacterium]|nr:N-6 DNA methylase [Thermoguttaceae bacterium]
MTNQDQLSDVVSKLWNLCNVLRDDGITYHQYVTELTYILFLKLAKEQGIEDRIPQAYRWDNLKARDGLDQLTFYKEILTKLGESSDELIHDIYSGAITNINEPKNLTKIVKSIDEIAWFSKEHERLGDLYEGLLEKNANEKKSGAGQYFTPRPLIDVMTRLIAPQPGERCNDPACGTFGFMIAASRYVYEHTDKFFDLPEGVTYEFELNQAFSGVELVPDAHRLALMNAMLHKINAKILQGDTLSSLGETLTDFDVVLTNPPFGTKKGGERALRSFTYKTSNKQLNFLQHIYNSLKPNGKARAAVVLPDNVLFDDGEGKAIRVDLMNKCNLHTILRLPTGIFYAQGVKTNVLFFTRGVDDQGNTNEVWFYDLRTNMPSFGKTNPLKVEDFAGFEAAYQAKDRRKVDDERWSVFTREQIAEKGDSLDLGLIRDESLVDYEELPDPVESGEDAVAQLEEALDLLKSVVDDLKKIEGGN